MKKKIALLGVLGVAGGLLYALESQHKRNKNKSTGDDLGASGKGLLVADSGLRQDEERQPTAAASMARIENREPAIGTEGEHVIDDQGTDQAGASEILKHIRDNAFEASDEKLALALGRPAEEIEEWISGNGLIDGDVILKARALAMQRGFEI
jgi:hypothetical protein